MKSALLSVLSCIFIPCVAFGASQIPSAFQGKWAVKKDCHIFAEIGTPDGGVEVTSTEFNRYEYYCKLEKVNNASAKLFSGEFTCAVEGEESKETIAIKLNAKGKLSYEGSSLLSKCK